MRRRLDLAGALVADPPVLFLDEPTTGLDPRSRIELWGVIRDMVARGSTLLLTTQYLEEAEHLADQIMVIDHGREIAYGTPDHLKTLVGGERMEVTLASAEDISRSQVVLGRYTVGDLTVDERTRKVTGPISGGTPVLTEALGGVVRGGNRFAATSGLRRPTLNDVFLSLTGRSRRADVRTTSHCGRRRRNQERG